MSYSPGAFSAFYNLSAFKKKGGEKCEVKRLLHSLV